MDPVNLPRITRHCIDVRGRQVHYRRRGNGPAVVMLHASPRSSAALVPLMQQGPAGVAMIALDTPGFGLSDALAIQQPGIEDFADALRDTLQALGITRAAIYGTHTGAAIGLALAVRHPGCVSRLVLDGVSAFSASERAMLLNSYLPPFEPACDGSHLARLWTRVRDQALFFPWNHRGTGARLWRALPDAAALHAAALDLLMAADYRGAYAAAISTDAAQWVARLRVPALIGASAEDVLFSHLQRLGQAPQGTCIEPTPMQRAAWLGRLWTGLCEGLPAELAPAARDGMALQLARPSASRLTDHFAGAAHQRMHWRGCAEGAGRPLVWLHASLGGPRSLEARLLRWLGQRPLVAPSLPGHGDSPLPAATDAAALIDNLEQLLSDLGLDDADIDGEGPSADTAAALAARRPGRWQNVAAPMTPSTGTPPIPPGPFQPRNDGGHLFAAWQHSRDEALLGPWWCRPERHDFGDTLDLAPVQRHMVEVLKSTGDQ